MVTFIHSPAHHVGAVQREIRDGERDGLEVRVLVAERTYPVGPDEVWDALTSPERIPRWLSPVTGDLRLGGRFQVEGNAGGEVLACDAPTHLALTWEMGGQVSWVDVHLSGEAETLLRLEHAAAVPKEFWDGYGPGSVGVGWELMLMGLSEHLADPAFDAAEVLALLASPDGAQIMGDLVHGSNDAWEQASVAYGTAPEQAHAAAERNLAFYTGAEAPQG